MNKKTFPYIAIAYVLVFLFIQVVSNYLVLAVNKLISDEPTEGLTPLATIIALAIFTLVSVALFLKMKWAEVSRNYIMTRPGSPCSGASSQPWVPSSPQPICRS